MKYATKLNEYFSGDKTLFLIPLYQRNYAWQRKHCERLFSDLEKIHKNNIYSHFFGSIVTVKASDHEDDLLIIDGQQRITTISLLILAAIKCVRDGSMQCELGEEYITDQKNKYLMAKYRKCNRKIKLRPIDNDIRAYDALFADDGSETVSSTPSGVTENFQLFCTLIKASFMTFENLIEAIERLTVIDIRLDGNDNPQLIFESLNSCGKDLEEADKVRNYLLMSLTPEEQEEYYRKYWRKIEDNTDYDPTMFIRDYLTVKNKTISSIAELYFDFKRYDEENNIPREYLLNDMLKYSVFYRHASKGEGYSENVKRKFKQLSYIGSMVCMPFYMSFLDYAQENGQNEDCIYEVLDVIENYWARRIICGYPANVMAKSFALLHSDVLRIIRQHERRGVVLTASYGELLKFILLRKQGTAKFPSDTELKDNFPKRQIYRIPLDYRCFLFERMENLDNKETNDSIVKKIKDGTYSFEHIMPQSLNTFWKEELGDEYERIHEEYLHTFANLTLTGYNSNYGNHSFHEKKNGYIDRKGNRIYGFKDSTFKLSNYLKTIDRWTEDEIKVRGNLLMTNFLYLWPMIFTSYVPLEKESDVISFDDDDIEVTNRHIQAYIYRGEKHAIDSWKGMLIEVCKLVYTEKPTAVAYLCAKDNWFHSYDYKKHSKIADNCYVWSSASAKSICYVLGLLFAETGIPKSQLEFDLIPLKENTVDDEELQDDLSDSEEK